MGIPVAKAHLLTPNKKFRCPYAVAIDYLDDLEFLKYSKELTNREKRDILAQFALAIMLNNSDIVQLYKCMGRVVQVDFGDSFNMGDCSWRRHFELEKKKLRRTFSTDVAHLFPQQ